MMKSSWLLGLVAAAAALSMLAAACGGDDDAKPTAKPAASSPAASAAAVSPTAAPPQVQTIQLTALEDGDKYTFDQKSITVKPGQITLHFTNKAGNARQHGFELKTLDGNGDVIKSQLVDSGSAADIAFAIKDPGTYQFLCFQRGHADRGQTGTIVVAGS